MRKYAQKSSRYSNGGNPDTLFIGFVGFMAIYMLVIVISYW